MSNRIDLSKLYIPTDRQVEAHIASERFILFGGAMGGVSQLGW